MRPHTTPVRRAGSSLAAVMIGALVIALVLGALLGSGASIHRHGHLNEAHLLALVRARALLDLVRALDFDIVHQRASAGGPVVVYLDTLIEPGAASRLFVTEGAAALPSYMRKIAAYDHRLTWTRLSADLARVDVCVSWTEAGPAAKVRQVRLSVLVGRPEAGYRAASGGGPA